MLSPSSSPIAITTLCFVLLGLIIPVLSSTNSIYMAESVGNSSPPSDSAAVYIVYTEKPTLGQEESHHLQTLSTVLGSHEAAKGALLYTYKNAATGFSAKLTPAQVEEIKKQPGVLQVVPSQTLQLHSGEARMTTSALQGF